MVFDPDLVDNSNGALETLVSAGRQRLEDGLHELTCQIDPSRHVYRAQSRPCTVHARHEEAKPKHGGEARCEAQNRRQLCTQQWGFAVSCQYTVEE